MGRPLAILAMIAGLLVMPVQAEGTMRGSATTAPCQKVACQMLGDEIVAALSLDTTLTEPASWFSAVWSRVDTRA